MSRQRIAAKRSFDAFLIFVLSMGVAIEAAAHGPTIGISHDASRPSLLDLFVGSTVHS